MNRLCAAFLLAAHVRAGGPVEPRAVWSVPGANVLGAPSLDGKFITCVDPASGDLAIVDTSTGKLRRLTEKGPSAAREFAYFSAPSRDGSQVAFAWFNDAGFYDLRVASVAAGGQPRVLFRNEEAGFVQPTSWTPDSKHILTLFFRKDNVSQISLVEAATGSVRVLKSLNWVYPKKMEISPDGRWIVYDTFAGDKPGPRDIYLLAIDGSSESKLVDSPAEDVFPVWSPDGKEVLFMSDRSGTMDAWAVQVEAGRAAGAPRFVRKDLGAALPMGVTARGDLIYGLRAGSTEVAILEAGSAEPPRVLATRTPGRNFAPAWSRDGNRLAYLSRRGAENFGTQSRAIVVRDVRAGSERDLSTRLAHIESIRWSPDGEWLLASGSDGKGRAGIFKVRVKDGVAQPVKIEPEADFRGVPGAWKPDGTIETASAPLAISSDGKRAAAVQADQVAVTGDVPRHWQFDSVSWLEWAGENLLATRAGKPYGLVRKICG